jgi:hypothetical protein
MGLVRFELSKSKIRDHEFMSLLKNQNVVRLQISMVSDQSRPGRIHVDIRSVNGAESRNQS